jgi:two-component system OmpR family sensor kinase
MMRSLRIRLILLFGAAILAAAAVQFTTSFRAAMQEANKLFDYHMQQMAFALEDSGFEEAGWHGMADADNESFDFVVQIWTDDGVRVYQSRSFRTLPQRGALGYSNVTLDNGDWRLYAVQTNTRVIQVAQRMEVRRSRAISLALHALWPVLPVSLLLFAAAWWVVTSALAPLNRIGHDLATRNADSLAPVSDVGVPQEVSLLIAEINSLLARVEQALQSQQRFVADAAHELRSPLTALKLQVQTLARARDDDARAQGVGRLLGGVDRASRLVEQLLSLARQDPLAQNSAPAIVPLHACIELAVSDVTSLAASRDIDICVGSLALSEIPGDADGLRILTRNLLDNAIRYTPRHGQVRIGLAHEDEHKAANIVLTVEDSGSGIPQPERVRIFDRFYRLPGTSQNGSGLGLAIVKAIAVRHGATVELSDGQLGGLAVNVRFPSQPASSPAPEGAASAG